MKNIWLENKLIIIDKGRHPVRGFLSYYISILTSFKHLTQSGFSLEDIRVDPYIFYTYGEASNWFKKDKIAFAGLEDSIFYSTDSWNIDPWPTNKQLDLLRYKEYFDYNLKTQQYLANNIPNIQNAIGIHFRGTDHYHTDRVELDKYIDRVIEKMYNDGYDTVFVATDEDGILEQIYNALPDISIIHNNTIKSSNGISVFDKDMSAEDKIESGRQVLLDSHCLAKCDTVFAKLSNVNYYSRILNPELEVVYLDKGSTVR